MSPDLDHYMTQGLICCSTAAILGGLDQFAYPFTLIGAAFVVLYCISFAERKYRGELYE